MANGASVDASEAFLVALLGLAKSNKFIAREISPVRLRSDAILTLHRQIIYSSIQRGGEYTKSVEKVFMNLKIVYFFRTILVVSASS